jgi:hypothetical protein
VNGKAIRLDKLKVTSFDSEWNIVVSIKRTN